MTNYASLLNLIPPAIIIAIIAYLARFFGKIMEDQNPFSDDREWSIELGGTLFMTNMAWGFIGIIIALSHPWGTTHSSLLHTVTVIILFILLGSQYVNNLYEGSKIFKVKLGVAKSVDEKFGEFLKKYAKISKFLGISVLSMILFYFGTLEFLSKDLYWIILSCLVMFSILVLAALNYSYRRIQKIVPVEIHFIDQKQKPILNARILKVNDDNIRLRVDNKIIILNKNIVSKIEMPIPPEMV